MMIGLNISVIHQCLWRIIKSRHFGRSQTHVLYYFIFSSLNERKNDTHARKHHNHKLQCAQLHVYWFTFERHFQHNLQQIRSNEAMKERKKRRNGCWNFLECLCVYAERVYFFAWQKRQMTYREKWASAWQ